jgi:hypothetical protein
LQQLLANLKDLRLRERLVLDAHRGAIELDDEGAMVDDWEERRARWRGWCGLSKVITMQSDREWPPGRESFMPVTGFRPSVVAKLNKALYELAA